MATMLDSAPVTGRHAPKEVRVEFTAHALLNQNNRGIMVGKGSVLDVPEEDAALLIASVKAKRTDKDIFIAPKPGELSKETPATNLNTQKKVS